MQELRVETPIESTDGTDPVSRLMARLEEEGFTADSSLSDWEEFGEIRFRRPEKISVARGETVFIFTRIPDVNERILRQTSETVVQTYTAKSPAQVALSVLQSTTVYHCLVIPGETPHNEALNEYITRTGGATLIPVVMVPAINQVLYPNLEDKVGSIVPRVEYLQYLLNERREPVNMHRQTVQAFYVSMAAAVLFVILLAVSLVR